MVLGIQAQRQLRSQIWPPQNQVFICADSHPAFRSPRFLNVTLLGFVCMLSSYPSVSCTMYIPHLHSVWNPSVCGPQISSFPQLGPQSTSAWAPRHRTWLTQSCNSLAHVFLSCRAQLSETCHGHSYHHRQSYLPTPSVPGTVLNGEHMVSPWNQISQMRKSSFSETG